MPDAADPEILFRTPLKGRGAVTNQTGRFERERRERVIGAWPGDNPFQGSAGDWDKEARPKTEVSVDASRTVIARNQSPDVPFDRSINPYRGCEHGCIYCFARPTHAYLGYSPGLDFETRLLAKPDAAGLLDAALRKPGYRPEVMALGTNTDPYQPIEKERGITREILQVLSEFGHPLSIVTKSALVTRDIDILAPMAARGLASVAISITTLDRDLARIMEPRAATPSRRLDAVHALRSEGVPVHMLAAPIIPAINDGEIEALVEASAEAGARGMGHILLRLPLEIKELFLEWLEEHFPDRAERVYSLIRQTRDGALYRAEWGERMRGTGPYAALIHRRFEVAKKRLGLASKFPPLRTDRFRVPPRKGDQLSLL
ncbi:PA0069 family radical SAM protein [Nisaea acidiphila]|uniref:PA0069 family radical SAM protein n=1 Tax=Nisaea acidiphila TaxID=1862145 RepID=A0A9J7AN27_9PROT|nr:PA0069 family radical SAM protein [Nisaea acidiphila]UUX47977.1 PA0069 family radical SAM protein [Nisaea acidiphila]